MAAPSAPSESTPTTTFDDTNTTKTTTTKTIYLIRHAETEENVRMHALQEAGRSIKSGRLPKMLDVRYGFNFLGMQLSGQTNSVLSPFGKSQVQQLHQHLVELQQHQSNTNNNKTTSAENWVPTLDIIAHSPLQRAKETCYGIFGILPNGHSWDEEQATLDQKLFDSEQRRPPVIQLDCLQEITPWETYACGGRPVLQRIEQLEQWIEHQTTTAKTIALVGHSEYFYVMLRKAGIMAELPQNCDVWKVQYQPGGIWSDLTLVHRLKPVTLDNPASN